MRLLFHWNFNRPPSVVWSTTSGDVVKGLRFSPTDTISTLFRVFNLHCGKRIGVFRTTSRINRLSKKSHGKQSLFNACITSTRKRKVEIISFYVKLFHRFFSFTNCCVNFHLRLIETRCEWIWKSWKMRWVSLRLFFGASYSTALKAHHGARCFWVNLIVIRRFVYATFYKIFCIPQNEFITIIPPPNSFYSTKPFWQLCYKAPIQKRFSRREAWWLTCSKYLIIGLTWKDICLFIERSKIH